MESAKKGWRTLAHLYLGQQRHVLALLIYFLVPRVLFGNVKPQRGLASPAVHIQNHLPLQGGSFSLSAKTSCLLRLLAQNFLRRGMEMTLFKEKFRLPPGNKVAAHI
jgi:hypothetical protein